jgi:hypothetical protein
VKIDGKSLTRAAVKEFAPDYFPGIIAELVEGKTVEEFYHFIEVGSLWDKISPGQQNWLLSYRPWKLDWLTIKWLLGAIGKANPTLGYLVGSSPKLQEKIQTEIDHIRQKLS